MLTSDSITLLRHLDALRAHSAAMLAEKLHTSQQKIHALIKDIEDAGIAIVHESKKNYRLAHPLDWLDLDAWQQAMQTRGAQLSKKQAVEQRTVTIPLQKNKQPLSLMNVVTIDSTSSELMRRLPHEDIHALTLAAEWQTAGRGRHGQPWYALPGGNLMFSLGWRFSQDSHFLSGLPMAISLAIANALTQEGFAHIQLKWPNDIVFHYQKLGGVLVEISNDIPDATYAVIGVGLNLFFPRPMREPITRAVTDLYSINKTMPERNTLLAAILIELVKTLTIYARDGFAAFSASWQERHAYHNRAVRLRLPDTHISKGIVVGIDDDGALILGDSAEDKDKGARYTAGEISLYPA